jgi:microcystin-dependent protein
MILKNGKRIDGCSDTVPIGTVNPFLGTTAPFGYLLLQGQKVSKTTYPELYEICGTTFGPETSTEFTLPDLRGQTIAGYKEGDSIFGTLGGLIGNKSISYTPAGINTGGAVGNHTLTTAEVPDSPIFYQIAGTAVGTTYKAYSSVPHGTGPFWSMSLGREGEYDSSANVDGGKGAHNHGFTNPTFTGTQTELNIVQPTVTLNWIVKAVMLIPNQSTVVNSETESSLNVYSCDFINDMLEQMKQEAFDFAHPVGSYYETSDSTWTPQAAGWYGTWVADNDGSALVSYKSSGAFNKAAGTIVGGESTNYTPAGTNTGGSVGNHTLTADESGLPAHRHSIEPYGGVGAWGVGGHTGMICENGENAFNAFYATENTAASASQAHNHGFTQPTFTGTATTLSTIQTSKVVYRWHRTA